MDNARPLTRAVLVACALFLAVVPAGHAGPINVNAVQQYDCSDPYNDTSDDSDADGLSLCAETRYAGTNPEVRDTDADGVPDGRDVNPAGTDESAVSTRTHTAESNLGGVLTVTIYGLTRLASCEHNDWGDDWGNRWDPYIVGTPFLQLPAGKSDPTGGDLLVPASLSRDTHMDERPDGKFSTQEAPTGKLTLPNDINDFGVSPGVNPWATLKIGFTEHDGGWAPGSRDDAIDVGLRSDGLHLPVSVAAPGTTMYVRTSADTDQDSDGYCPAEMEVQFDSDLSDKTLASAVIGNLKLNSNSFATMADVLGQMGHASSCGSGGATCTASIDTVPADTVTLANSADALGDTHWVTATRNAALQASGALETTGDDPVLYHRDLSYKVGGPPDVPPVDEMVDAIVHHGVPLPVTPWKPAFDLLAIGDEPFGGILG